jgi:hypothetical protein
MRASQIPGGVHGQQRQERAKVEGLIKRKQIRVHATGSICKVSHRAVVPELQRLGLKELHLTP